MKLSLVPSAVATTPDTAGTPGTGALDLRILAAPSPMLHTERPPVFVYDPHHTSLGVGLERGWTTPRTPLAYRVISNARSIGQRLITDTEGNVVLDELHATEEACDRQMTHFADRSTSLYHEDTDVVKTEAGFFSDRLDTPQVVIEEPVLSLLSVEPSNYGSWLFRVIPKLLFAEKLGGAELKIVCWAPAQWQKDLLSFFGVSEDRLIIANLGICYQYRTLFVPVVINPYAYLSEDTLAFYRAALQRNGIVQKRERLIYLSRHSRAAASGFNNVRHFTDEQEMIRALSAIGFEIVEPENLSIRDQLALFASAAMVVGASGAGMFNTAFCAPGTAIIDIEAFPHWLYAHCNYFSSCGHTYGIAFGKVDETDDAPAHKRWTIGISGIVNKVQQMRNLSGL